MVHIAHISGLTLAKLLLLVTSVFKTKKKIALCKPVKICVSLS